MKWKFGPDLHPALYRARACTPIKEPLPPPAAARHRKSPPGLVALAPTLRRPSRRYQGTIAFDTPGIDTRERRYDGEPCGVGHVSRYRWNNACVKCTRNAARNERRREDPASWALEKATKNKQRQAARHANPVKYAEELRKNHEYALKRRADPVKREAELEYFRAYNKKRWMKSQRLTLPANRRLFDN